MDDVGRYMVEGLKRDDLVGRRIVIGGPECLAIEAVLEILSEAVGRPIALDYIPPRQFGEYLHGRLTERMGEDKAGAMLADDRKAFADFFENFYMFNNFAPERPFEVDVDAVARLIPLPLTRLSEWVRYQDWTVSQSFEGTGSSVG